MERKPTVSIIVPIYNVAEYLAECLDSLARQTLQDIEIVMVDDGSTDGSGDIAEQFARRDDRFRLIRQPNGGLGKARNVGVDAISPDSCYLIFVDSDDALTPEACDILVGSLEKTGSDFATGNVLRLNSRGTTQSPMHRYHAQRDRERTHVSKETELLSDRIACNKLFRTEFWKKHELRFPEGVLYEDTPVIVPAHCLASSVDVLMTPVYLWREREGGSAPSITQRRTEPKAVRDRLAGVTTVSRFLAQRPGDAQLKHLYDRSALLSDALIFLRVLPQGDEEFRTAFFDVACAFLEGVSRETLMSLTVELRIKWLLVQRRAEKEVLDLLAAEAVRDPYKTRGLRRRHVQLTDLEASPRLPRWATRIHPSQLRLQAPLRTAEWQDGRLVVSGDAWVPRVGPSKPNRAKRLAVLKEKDSRRALLLPVRSTYRPERSNASGTRRHNYDWAGFSFTIDPERLRGRSGWREGVWRVGLGAFTAGRLGKARLAASHNVQAGHAPYRWLDDEHRMLPITQDRSFRIRIEKVRATVHAVRVEDEAVVVEGELRTALPQGHTVRLELDCMSDSTVRPYEMRLGEAGPAGRRPFSARVPVDDVAFLPPAVTSAERAAGRADDPKPNKRGWEVRIRIQDDQGRGSRHHVVVAEDLRDGHWPLPERLREAVRERGPVPSEIAVTGGNDGYLQIWGRTGRAVVTEARWGEDGELTMAGTISAVLHEPELVVRMWGGSAEKVLPLEVDADGAFRTAFNPSAHPGLSGVLPLQSGRWDFWLRSCDPATGLVMNMPFKVDRLVAAECPASTEVRGRRYALETQGPDYPNLYCYSHLAPEEEGPYRGRQMRRGVYRVSRETKPLRDAVLYVSYNGKQYSDSPKAMYAELSRTRPELEHLWVVRDGQVDLPPELTPVRLWGKEWYEALATCRYIVTNAHLPDWIERREGQVIVQTWHGTMLKKIGLDIAAPKFDPGYLERLPRETRNWSLLVSANRFSTPILKRAFGFEGEILESGYPRNDVLYAPDRDQQAARVKRLLGVPQDKKVVLYAPTWRDDQSHGKGRFRFDLRLDLQEARERLGADHVLLVRRHSNAVDSVPGAGDGFVYDVSEYPDISELYLIADLMITDYSSVMFDYAHTGRPMLFFTYDLEHYRDTLRGFYFDFEAEAPGPLLTTSGEVLQAVRDIDSVQEKYAESYGQFRRRFCDFGDGLASKRVAERMLELGGGR
ncbi:bifunctional glycosyltransferase/CDP-glycerol:glycerophosphate glycerophosphotransferase [Streptomyces indicus]|uniref:CDP-glycerol glycerophosphotransferase n=1 Tax=Streptomyces indicus TaxID=417292 RepID=A0A1G9E0H6_9ACTN|nr:bifunctional glycosyltransferase family 2 protein/CDP-glycerol:glycerophosphate glycerophosphotransferase [Streptomyces indicus]SDK69613.1 CDP-glycerol glycerophosphotransferase [Streptomyces indicus]